MNTKKLITLAVILALAVGTILLVKGLSSQKPSEESLQFFPGISEKAIGAIVLKDSQDWIKLQRKGDAWVLVPKQALSAASAAEKQASGLSKAMGTGATGASVPAGLAAAEFPVDSTAIGQLVANVLKMKKDILVSENPAKQETFEVDSIRGCRVEVFDVAGKSLGTAILGKNAPDYTSLYSRAEKSNAVYQMQDVSRYAFGSDHKRWTDKSLMKFDKAAVKQIAITKRDTSKVGKGAVLSIVIARGDSAKGWQLVEPVKKTADSAKVDEILSSLSNLQAAEYEDSAYTDSATGLANPFIKVALTFASGTVRTLSIGSAKPGQSKSWIRVPEKRFVYLMNDSDQKKFDKKPDDFAVQPIKPIQAVAAPIPPSKFRKTAPAKK